MIQSKISRFNLSKYIRQILIAYLLIFSIFFSCIVSSNSLSESEDKNIINSSKTNFLGNGVFEIVNEERSNLTKIGQWDENYGIPDDFYIEEDKLYANNGQEGLLVFDIIDKANPKLLRTINFTDYCIDLIIKDNHAFIVLQTGSLEVLDLTVENQSLVISHYDSMFEYRNLAISENILYATSNLGYIIIYNITSSGQLEFIDTIDFPLGVPNQIVATNTTLYCSCTNELFKIFNITDLTNISLLDSYSIALGDDYSAFCIADDIIYLAIDSHEIIVVNATILSDLSNVTRFDINDDLFLESMSVNNNSLFGVDFNEGVFIWDISNISSPVYLNNFKSYYLTCFQLFDNIALLITLNHLISLNYTDLANLEIVSDFDFGGRTTDVVVQNNLAYIANAFAGIDIINITDKTNPIRIGCNREIGYVQKLVVQDNYLYADAGSNHIEILEISNPKNPFVISNYTSENYQFEIWDLFIVDSFLYIAACYAGLEIIDISNPLHPVLAGTYKGNYAVFDVIVEEDTAYLVTYNNNLVSLDITDRTNPQVMAEKSQYGWFTYDVALYSDYIYIIGNNYDGNAGFLIYKLKNQPIIDYVGEYVSQHSFLDHYFTDIDVHHDFVYLTNYHYGLDAIDCSDKTNPFLQSSYYNSTNCFSLMVYDDYLYVADGYDGMGIFLPLTGTDNNWVIGFSIFASVIGVTVIVVLVFVTIRRKRRM